MSNSYESLLTNEQKRQLIQNRISQFAAEAYQYSLNKKSAESVNNEQQAESAAKALELLEAAIKVHQEELDKLPLSEVQN